MNIVLKSAENPSADVCSVVVTQRAVLTYTLAMECNRCHRVYEYDRAKGHRVNLCNSCNVTLARQKMKLKAVQYMGGKCKCCGYSICLAALEFHHLDPSQKDFGISEGGIPRNWEKVKKELDKCILVCNRCHTEIHAGFRNIPL